MHSLVNKPFSLQTHCSKCFTECVEPVKGDRVAVHDHHIYRLLTTFNYEIVNFMNIIISS